MLRRSRLVSCVSHLVPGFSQSVIVVTSHRGEVADAVAVDGISPRRAQIGGPVRAAGGLLEAAIRTRCDVRRAGSSSGPPVRRGHGSHPRSRSSSVLSRAGGRRRSLEWSVSTSSLSTRMSPVAGRGDPGIVKSRSGFEQRGLARFIAIPLAVTLDRLGGCVPGRGSRVAGCRRSENRRSHRPVIRIDWRAPPTPARTSPAAQPPTAATDPQPHPIRAQGTPVHARPTRTGVRRRTPESAGQCHPRPLTLSSPLHGTSSSREADDGIFPSIRRASALMQSCLLRDLGFDAERTTELLRQHYRAWPIP